MITQNLAKNGLNEYSENDLAWLFSDIAKE